MNEERYDALGTCKEGLCEEGHLSHGPAEAAATETLGTEGSTGRGRGAGVKGDLRRSLGGRKGVGYGHAVPIKGFGF